MASHLRIDRSQPPELARRVANFLSKQGGDVCHLKVEVSHDVVTVRGHVKSEAARQLAASCCQRVAGVRRVVNEAVVGSPEV